MNSSLSRDRSEQIALLNDAFRLTFTGGLVCVTAGVQILGDEFVQLVLRKVRMDDTFTKDNDPYGEHDFGTVIVQGRKLFWSIDYYALDMIHGSEDPADVKNTRRVLTVMLAEEY
jgi:hypothetical protein